MSGLNIKEKRKKSQPSSENCYDDIIHSVVARCIISQNTVLVSKLEKLHFFAKQNTIHENVI